MIGSEIAKNTLTFIGYGWIFLFAASNFAFGFYFT